jgi:DNA polymerase III delta prime subunit
MSALNTSLLISNIYNSRKIILELMEKQGYNVEDYANFSVNEVNTMKQNNQLDILLEKKNPDAITGKKNKIPIAVIISISYYHKILYIYNIK